MGPKRFLRDRRPQVRSGRHGPATVPSVRLAPGPVGLGGPHTARPPRGRSGTVTPGPAPWRPAGARPAATDLSPGSGITVHHWCPARPVARKSEQ
eukprot:223289-Hanusia_phi.AAC.1